MNDGTSVKSDRIAVGVGAALLVAGLILVLFVLPAEFAVDPIGTGRLFGLLPLGETARQIDAFKSSQTDASGASDGAGTAIRTIVPQDRGFQQEAREFEIPPGVGMEYKYRLEKGESLLFSWQTKPSQPVTYEFHAEPDGAPAGYAETYEKGGARQASGTLVAPFTGIHGWYWENTGTSPLTVSLTAAGFYNMSHEFQKDQPVKTTMFK